MPFWIFALILLLLGSAAWASVRGAPWVPTYKSDMYAVLRAAALRPGELFIDLGCGDGRVLFVAAKHFGVHAVGYEISILPYLAAQFRWLCSPHRGLVRIRFGDFFRADLHDADAVFCFLVPATLARLKKKFVQELRPSSRVLSYSFPIPGWLPYVQHKPTSRSLTVWCYHIPAYIQG